MGEFLIRMGIDGCFASRLLTGALAFAYYCTVLLCNFLFLFASIQVVYVARFFSLFAEMPLYCTLFLRFYKQVLALPSNLVICSANMLLFPC